VTTPTPASSAPARRLLIVGPPGAGKGTQAVRVAEELSIPAISTGDIFRANVSGQTELGVLAKSYMDKGEYVPDSVTNDMVRSRLAEADAQDGFLLDGYPRTLDQVEALDGMLAELGTPLDLVLLLVVEPEEVVGRLVARGAEQGRSDDTEETIRRRLEVYAEQTAVMRRSGHLLHRVHDMLEAAIRPGITTDELDSLAHTMIRDEGAIPNFLGYQGYPATLCISVNDVVVHGIPDSRPLEEGDVVSIDGGLIVDGWHSDAARTHIVGRPRSVGDEDLVRITEEALWAGIAALATADRVGDVGAAIEDYVAEAAGESLSHLEGFGGHGIGTAMHQAPDVMNYRTRSRGPRVRPGLCIAIEPMLIQGRGNWELEDDEWTVRATCGGRAAHAEHSVAVTEQGLLVLTAGDGGAAELARRGVVAAPDPLGA
jgi:methionyl aminopeptidase